jgi:hypothetical protein
MKVIQAMKEVKDLLRKANDIRTKRKTFCADLNNQDPAYKTTEAQEKQIREWGDAHRDILRLVEKRRVQIQKTNISKNVVIEIAGQQVQKCIAAWIHRRRDLADLEAESWSNLSTGRLSESAVKDAKTGEVVAVKIRRYYDQAERDKMVEIFTSEKSIIDGSLEVANATTDLIED